MTKAMTHLLDEPELLRRHGVIEEPHIARPHGLRRHNSQPALQSVSHT
jgi:hypothetical protein